MDIKSLVPWNRWFRKSIPVRREEENPILALRHEMDRLFDEFTREWFDLAPFEPFAWKSSGFVPKVDVTEDDKEVRVSVELPGMEEKDIDVSLTRDSLTIKGEKKVEKEDKGKDYYRMERSYGAFQRTIPLPEGIDTDKVEATFRNGVLTVVLPRTEEAQKEIKKIPVKTS